MLSYWFKKQMGMYFAYHQNAYNCFFHFIGVPLILFSIILLLSTFHLLSYLALNITIGSLSFFSLLIFYLLAMPIMGISSIIIYLPLFWLAQNIILNFSDLVWLIALLSFVFGWIAQFIGHIYEQKRPAFFDNILQVFMAPGFLVIEILFSIGMCQNLKNDLEKYSENFKLE